jgi:hypothetical protein
MGVYEMAKDALTLAQKAGNVEIVKRLLDLQAESLNDRETIRVLREEVAELRKRTKVQDELRWEHNVYWRELNAGACEGPFCGRCWDGEGKLARFAEFERDVWWKCVVCAVKVQRPGVERPKYNKLQLPSYWTR